MKKCFLAQTKTILAGFLLFACVMAAFAGNPRTDLADEVKDKGWIAFSARSPNGSWDLFVMRPDGSDRKALTDTPEVEEAAPRYSPDGKNLLYRVMKRGTVLDHDQWGFSGSLVMADWDGSNARKLSDDGGLPWASWSPDGTQIVCLTLKGILVVDIATKEVVRTIDRQGIFQQMYWSRDGKWLCGVGNYGGQQWTIMRLDMESEKVNEINSFQSCTPDWFADSQHVIYSCRPSGQPANRGYGFTQLWMADAAGGDQKLVYGEDGTHAYGAALSPDDTYVLFTRCEVDGGGAETAGGSMHLMRLADAPVIRGRSVALRKVHASSDIKAGPVLTLPRGWEPHWTYAQLEYE